MEFRLRKIRENNDDKFMVDFLLMGGPLELKFFLGNSPEEVINRYHQYLNGYMIPEFWTLGYHQCRYGWKSINEIESKVKFYREHDIPIDTIWVDIDHMNNYKSFTFNYLFP